MIMGTTTPGQSGYKSNCIEVVHHIQDSTMESHHQIYIYIYIYIYIDILLQITIWIVPIYPEIF